MFRLRSSKASVSLYVSLGLTKNASQDDIKRAYGLLQEKYKQDAKDKKKCAKKKLKDIERAYCVLGDPSKRARYDEYGTVGWWCKVRHAFSPEAIDKHNPVVKGLWMFCFTVTGCCFCYCCNHCCNTCKPDTCDHDDDEIYIRATFSEYLTESSTHSGSPFARKRRKEEVRQAARRRRQDLYNKKGPLGKVKEIDGKRKQECEVGEEKIDSDGKGLPLKTTKRSIISKDSGCDIGLDNNGYVHDIDGESITNSEGFSEEHSIGSDQASVEIHSTGNNDDSDVSNGGSDRASIEVHSTGNNDDSDVSNGGSDRASVEVHSTENHDNSDVSNGGSDRASIEVHSTENHDNSDVSNGGLDRASIEVHSTENHDNSDVSNGGSDRASIEVHSTENHDNSDVLKDDMEKRTE